MIPIVLVYFATGMEIGWNVWWYFLLLMETRTIPAVVVLFGVFFLSTAGTLAHALHERGQRIEDYGWKYAGAPGPSAERRRGGPRRIVNARLPRRRHG